MLYINKYLSESVKDVDVKQGIVTGYFSKFGNEDSDGDIIQKGAYTKTIQESFKRIKHFLDHDKTKAIGILQVLKEDDYGLYYESKAGRHTLGQDFLLMAEDGIITEHSVGIIAIKQARNEKGTNVMSEVRMVEGSSLQAWGANEFTPITGVKSDKDIISLFETLEKALRNGKYTDEAFKEIELKYNELKEIFTKADSDVTSAESIDPLSKFLFK